MTARVLMDRLAATPREDRRLDAEICCMLHDGGFEPDGEDGTVIGDGFLRFAAPRYTGDPAWRRAALASLQALADRPDRPARNR